MTDQYFVVNIRVYLDKDKPTYIGERALYELLSGFSCPQNPDVEYFLLHNAVEFTKKDQSVTYLHTINSKCLTHVSQPQIMKKNPVN